jgi:hypothetical protein
LLTFMYQIEFRTYLQKTGRRRAGHYRIKQSTVLIEKIIAMDKFIIKNKRCADQIASQIIELHQQGFTDDFIITGEGEIICLQNNATYHIDDIILLLMGHGYDKRFRSYKFIYVVVTSCGLKGLLLENLFFLEDLLN